jgi:hypothetical protein
MSLHRATSKHGPPASSAVAFEFSGPAADATAIITLAIDAAGTSQWTGLTLPIVTGPVRDTRWSILVHCNTPF